MLPGKAARILFFVAIAGVFVGNASAPVIGEARTATDEHPPRRVHVRGDVMRTRLKHTVEPVYPPIARGWRIVMSGITLFKHWRSIPLSHFIRE